MRGANQIVEPRFIRLIGLSHQIMQLVQHLAFLVHKRHGDTLVTGSTRSANTVHVVIDIGGHIVVDNVQHVRKCPDRAQPRQWLPARGTVHNEA